MSLKPTTVHRDGTYTTKPCDICGKEFPSYVSQNRRYCSKACYGESKLQRIDEFWDRVNKAGPIPSRYPELGPCWLWTGAIMGKNQGGGYGNIRFHRQWQLAHRMSWMLSFGEIPEKMMVLHRCDVRLCVNPEHLFLGDHDQNMRDMAAKSRGNKKARKLTEEQARLARELHATGISMYRIARMLSVSDLTISRIVQGLSYRSAL